jgi:tetratricopeptide (TPR) repeat protein
MSWSVVRRCSVFFHSEPILIHTNRPFSRSFPQRLISTSGMTMNSKVGHAAALFVACLLGSSTGCRSIEVDGLDMFTAPLSSSYTAIKDATASDDGRHPDAGSGPTLEERLRYEQATQLAESGRHAEAEALLLDLKGQGAARFFDFSKRTRKSFLKELDQDRRLGDALNPNLVDPRAGFREDALFLLAESQFHQKKYSAAQDSYTELMVDFPSTRRIDRASARLFEIGRYWLDTQNFEAAAQIRPAGATVPAASLSRDTPGGWMAGLPFVPNISDGTRPVFDTRGQAMLALKTIWLNDPTGHLADDALMLAAATHLEQGDSREADRILTNLRKLYPNSPYLEPAFLLGSHVRLMGYQGSHYDQTPLDEAAQLKTSTLGLFPDIKEKERLKAEMADIETARAEREWQRVEFYRKKNLPKAMAVHLNRILARFDGTVHAQRARKELLALGTEYANGRWMASEIRAAGNPLPVASVDAVDPVTPAPTSTPAVFPSRTELEAPGTTPVVPSGPQFPAQPEPEPELGSAPEFQPPETAAEPESSVREIPSM